MARPLKKGLSYFPLDTDLPSNRKIQRLSRRYGCNGICIYLTALCEIYKGNGYYIPFSKDFCFDVGFTLDLDEKEVEQAIRFCAEIKLFDPGLFDSRQILTSEGIQQRYLEICKRNVVRMDPELQLPAGNRFCHQTDVSVTETPVLAAETPVKEKGNKKEKTTTQHGTFIQPPFPNDNGEAARRAELLRMAAAATRNR